MSFRIIFIGFLVCSALSAQTPAELSIDIGRPKASVSPILYGLMTEEINYSYDGGLYAELIRNRMFRSDWTGILNWFLIEKGNSSAKLTVDKNSGPSSALSTSAKLDVGNASADSPAGILNEGYWGFAVRPDTRYTGSFFAKSKTEDPVPVTIALRSDTSQKALTTATVTIQGTAWKEYKFEMRSGNLPTSAENHFELLVDRPATLWFQLVSLFPPTYKSRPNGNRTDIMEKLAAMRPSFLRFPGGNYLEGNSIETRFNWRKTVGPLVERPTHPTTWNYHSSDGMGLLEFLEWCEDLKMEPVLGVYAGYSLGGGGQVIKPGPELEPYVQEALDEIEYVTGGPETKGGALRASHRHAAPFPLRFVEIGNEDSFDRSHSYEGRFAQYFKAIKAKYPSLQLIATMPVKETAADLVDDHYYKRHEEMFDLAKHYDQVDRKGPKIFVGEWATREGGPTPNFGSALGDAAFLTGLERNSDLVLMSAYAPLFVNVNPGGMQWSTDLIGYNAESSYGSPAYYAQVMFSSCLGDQTAESSVSGAGDRFFYSATFSSKSKKICLKLVNGASNPQSLTVVLKGLDTGVHKGALQTLKADSLRSTNSITSPERIIPAASKITVMGGRLQHTMPGYSIQVLELEME